MFAGKDVKRLFCHRVTVNARYPYNGTGIAGLDWRKRSPRRTALKDLHSRLVLPPKRPDPVSGIEEEFAGPSSTYSRLRRTDRIIQEAGGRWRHDLIRSRSHWVGDGVSCPASV